MTSESTAPRLRVATYNVHGCVGMDRQRSESRIAEVITSTSADIVGLQELDLGRARSEHVDQVALIAAQLGWKYHFHPAMRRGDEALDAMSPGANEQRKGVEFFEVPVQTVS